MKIHGLDYYNKMKFWMPLLLYEKKSTRFEDNDDIDIIIIATFSLMWRDP